MFLPFFRSFSLSTISSNHFQSPSWINSVNFIDIWHSIVDLFLSLLQRHHPTITCLGIFFINSHQGYQMRKEVDNWDAKSQEKKKRNIAIPVIILIYPTTKKNGEISFLDRMPLIILLDYPLAWSSILICTIIFHFEIKFHNILTLNHCNVLHSLRDKKNFMIKSPNPKMIFP